MQKVEKRRLPACGTATIGQHLLLLSQCELIQVRSMHTAAATITCCRARLRTLPGKSPKRTSFNRSVSNTLSGRPIRRAGHTDGATSICTPVIWPDSDFFTCTMANGVVLKLFLKLGSANRSRRLSAFDRVWAMGIAG